MQLATRMRRLGTETAFDVLAQVKQLEAEGKRVLSFAIGEPDFDTPRNIKDAAIRAINENYTHYNPSAGLAEFRAAAAKFITKTRGAACDPENIVCVPGGKPIIFYAILALIDEGDEVIYPNPGYPIYESMINFVGGTPIPLPLVESMEFSFDFEQLQKLVTAKTKMIILNSPNNPTGGVIPRADLERVARLAQERDLWVLSDEVYSKMIYDGTFESIYQFPEVRDRIILVEGHSKSYAMTGWRLGFGVMHKDLAVQIAKLMTNSNSCTCTFNQIAGIEALEGPQTDSEAMVKEFKERRELVVNGLNDIEGIKCLLPKGAFYVFPNVTKVCKKHNFANSKELQMFLLYQAGVAVLGRTCFGRRNVGEKDEYIRLSYATSKQNIKEGLQRIKHVLQNEKLIKEFFKAK